MTAWDRFSIPGKAFILGEYAVLASGQGLIATLAPRFELARTASGADGGPGKDTGQSLAELSSSSPARLLIDRDLPGPAVRGDLLEARFRDPHRGSGGFGGSTAEFALTYAVIHGADAPVAKVWSAYREIQPQASGADLAAQWSGGVVIADPLSASVERIERRHLFNGFFVFSAAHQQGRKVKTHEHLAALRGASLDRLIGSSALSEGLQAARCGNFESFARSVNEYARLLGEMGLEHPRTAEDRAALRDVPGICAVKGTGAMQADAVIVFGDPELRSEDLFRAIEPVASSRDLRLVARGWSEERGILP